MDDVERTAEVMQVVLDEAKTQCDDFESFDTIAFWLENYRQALLDAGWHDGPKLTDAERAVPPRGGAVNRPTRIQVETTLSVLEWLASGDQDPAVKQSIREIDMLLQQLVAIGEFTRRGTR